MTWASRAFRPTRWSPLVFGADLAGWWNASASGHTGTSPTTAMLDLSGNGRSFTGTGTVNLASTGPNSLPVLDYGSAGTGRSMLTASITLGVFTLFHVVKPTGAGFLHALPNSGAVNAAYSWIPGALRMSVARSSVASVKDVAAWANDSTWRSWAQSFGGTHATHLGYLNGSLVSTTNPGATSDPGTGTVAAALAVGSDAGAASSFQGLWRETILIKRAITAAEAAKLHEWAQFDSQI